MAMSSAMRICHFRIHSVKHEPIEQQANSVDFVRAAKAKRGGGGLFSPIVVLFFYINK
jgi:hypothetical protein